MKGPGQGPGTHYNFEVWLTSEPGQKRVLVPQAVYWPSRVADAIRQGETRSYEVPVAVAAEIPPGHYKLRAKRPVVAPSAPELLSNTLDVQVKSDPGTRSP